MSKMRYHFRLISMLQMWNQWEQQRLPTRKTTTSGLWHFQPMTRLSDCCNQCPCHSRLWAHNNATWSFHRRILQQIWLLYPLETRVGQYHPSSLNLGRWDQIYYTADYTLNPDMSHQYSPGYRNRFHRRQCLDTNTAHRRHMHDRCHSIRYVH